MSHLQDLVSGYVDGELYYAARREVERHLEECGACRIELKGVTEARRSLRELPVLEAPPELLGDRQRGLVASLRSIRPAWGWAAAGAAAAAALVMTLAVGPGEPGPSIDLDSLADRHTARVVFEPGISTVRAVLEGP